MVVNSIELKDYRNIAALSLELCETVNIIYGDNAQGKTNLIEAVWMCSGAGSFRPAKTGDFIRFGQPFSEIRMSFTDSERRQEAKLRFTGKKEFTLNGVPLKKAGEMSGHFYCVAFTPSDLELAGGAPRSRRQFLDAAISQITPQYAGYLDQYDRVLEQRNALLKDLYRFPDLRDTIEVWDRQIAKLGTILTIYRVDYLEKLGGLVREIYDGISASREKLALSYTSTVFEQPKAIRKYDDEAINEYHEKLSRDLQQDTRLGYTSCGIHRDDIELMIDDKPVKVFGSRGQVRSSVLALKLAEAELLRKITGENPVILLDDVMSELDVKRQDYILNHVKEKQVFITCCDIWGTIQLQTGKVFHIGNGCLESEKSVGESQNKPI